MEFHLSRISVYHLCPVLSCLVNSPFRRYARSYAVYFNSIYAQLHFSSSHFNQITSVPNPFDPSLYLQEQLVLPVLILNDSLSCLNNVSVQFRIKHIRHSCIFGCIFIFRNGSVR